MRFWKKKIALEVVPRQKSAFYKVKTLKSAAEFRKEIQVQKSYQEDLDHRIAMTHIVNILEKHSLEGSVSVSSLSDRAVEELRDKGYEVNFAAVGRDVDSNCYLIQW